MSIRRRIFFVSLFIFIFYPNVSSANLSLITWRGEYYQSIPNKKNVSLAYCQAHAPGIFIHRVPADLTRPIITNKGILLERATFSMTVQQGVYFMQGDVWASGTTNHVKWQDHIVYHVYKLTEAGVTRGIWSSPECKGLYLGMAIKNNNVTAKR